MFLLLLRILIAGQTDARTDRLRRELERRRYARITLCCTSTLKLVRGELRKNASPTKSTLSFSLWVAFPTFSAAITLNSSLYCLFPPPPSVSPDLRSRSFFPPPPPPTSNYNSLIDVISIVLPLYLLKEIFARTLHTHSERERDSASQPPFGDFFCLPFLVSLPPFKKLLS